MIPSPAASGGPRPRRPAAMAMGNSGINGKSHPAYRHQGPDPGAGPRNCRLAEFTGCSVPVQHQSPSAAGLLLLLLLSLRRSVVGGNGISIAWLS